MGVASGLGIPAAVVRTEAVREGGMRVGPDKEKGEREEETGRGQLAQGQGVPCDRGQGGLHHTPSSPLPSV